MKRPGAIITLCIGIGVLGYLVWLFGIICELEYPYVLTLANARSAKSVAGDSIKKVIKASGTDWEKGHWHTCSYCAFRCGGHKNLISVRLDAPSGTWVFAYCSTTDQLVPMSDQTAARFPALMPPGDSLEDVNDLNGNVGGVSWVYGQELKLPAKWFHTVTGK